jgi:oxidase EvaA
MNFFDFLNLRKIYEDMIFSGLTTTGSYQTLDEFHRWRDQIKERCTIDIQIKPLNELRSWKFDYNTGNIEHINGSFFKIRGLSVNQSFGPIKSWTQPIIDQSEIGVLGFIIKYINGVIHFLVQAKIEPGNKNGIQISPTVQATYSNFTQKHGGVKPHYVELFLKNSGQVLFDQLQSEQGSRFYKKRNRNIIILIKENFDLVDGFTWLTLNQIKKIILIDDLVNMDTRTVLSQISIHINTYIRSDKFNLLGQMNVARFGINMYKMHSLNDSELDLNFKNWFTRMKFIYNCNPKIIDLNEVEDWSLQRGTYSHKKNKYFKIIGVNVRITGREVSNWDQPMITPLERGLVGLICKQIDGVIKLLIQAKPEPGCFDIVELAPTVQCITGSYVKPEYEVPFLNYFLNWKDFKVLYHGFQSEEGGRFYHESNENMIILLDADKFLEIPENYFWLSVNQLKSCISFSNIVNVQLRSILSILSIV